MTNSRSYGVTANDITVDLTAGKGRPEWVFSAYGPGRNAPRQLFGGPQREQSFEEMRLRHYEAAATGNMQQAVQEADALYADSLRQMDVALNDIDGAVKYVIDGANEHPNRIDIIEGKTGPGFGQGPAQPSQTAFGQPSGTGGAFGRPSAFGQSTTPAPSSSFGQPSAVGQGSTFAQPASLGPAQPTFGQPSFGQPGFSQPSQPSQPAFGKPSFGQPAFGQPSGPGAGAFGQPITQSPFNQISNQNQPSGIFGQPSGQPTSPFNQPKPSGPSTFGQPSQPGAGPFGQPAQPAAPFGQPPSGQNRFGQPQQQPAQPFGQPAAPSGFNQPPPQTTVTPETKPAVFNMHNPNELNPIPPMSGQTTRDMDNKLTAWKGQPVQYINDYPCYLHPQDQRTWVRINFPDGPPDEATLRDSEGKSEEYTPEIAAQYEFFLKNGYFKDGLIPPVPPKREWISWDF